MMGVIIDLLSREIVYHEIDVDILGDHAWRAFLELNFGGIDAIGRNDGGPDSRTD